MSNPVYSLVSAALGRVVSERAADHMLRAALRDAKVSPESVSAEEMQRVLAGPLETRLTALMPPARARYELSALAGRLQAKYPKAPTLFPEMDTPVKAPGNTVIQVTEEWRAVPASAAAVPPAGFTPVTPTLIQDARPTVNGGEASFDLDAFEFDADDFEFDDPQEPNRVQLPVREYALSLPAGQDRLLTDLARFDGVQGVVLCDANGKVLRARVARGADALGAVMAATAALLKQRRWRILCADLGAQTVCIKPVGQHYVALLTGNNTNLGRLIAELSVLKEAA